MLNATGYLIGFWLDGIVFGRNDARRTFNYHKVKDAQYVISSLQNMKSNESRQCEVMHDWDFMKVKDVWC